MFFYIICVKILSDSVDMLSATNRVKMGARLDPVSSGPDKNDDLLEKDACPATRYGVVCICSYISAVK